ncbi:MAG: class B sortase [Propionibacteriaceae bacterium]|jgi:sortase B|nr:class B sortase [Propionibacteriaceae bacterium]
MRWFLRGLGLLTGLAVLALTWQVGLDAPVGDREAADGALVLHDRDRGSGRDAVPAVGVDVGALRTANKEIVAWLSWDGIDLDEPVAQGQDNVFYLTHNAFGEPSESGAVFSDHRARADFSDFNTVLYGHNMLSGAVFGRLADFLDPAYYAAHPTGWLDTPAGRQRLELVAAATTDARSFYYDYSFPSPADKRSHLTRLRESAALWSGDAVTESDRLVVLSTCANGGTSLRTVVVARLTPDPDDPPPVK